MKALDNIATKEPLPCHAIVIFPRGKGMRLPRLAQGKSGKFIASHLERNPSTISREIRRNRYKDGGYRPVTADRRYQARRQRPLMLDCRTGLAQFVRDQLSFGWTLEQIAGWLRRGVENIGYVCHETIYAWIYSRTKTGDKLWK